MRKSNPTTSRGNTNTNGLCCGMGLIQVIVLWMCIGQAFLIFFLLGNHDIFRSSITDIGQLTRNLLQPETSHIQGVISSSEYNRRTSDISPPLSSEPFLVEYTNNFPVIIKSIDNDIFIPMDSRPTVRSILGTIIDVNFPDLSYRPKEVVRSQYTTIFEELPAYGFSQEFKNPCWRDSNNHLKCLPYAYILGQPKCGTSDLFERMRVHQDIVAPIRKEIRWFTRGEFLTHAMWHEGMDNENVDHLGEPLLGPGSTLTTFSRSFRALQNALETSPELHKDKITIDGGPHTFWWPTQSPDGNYESWDVPPPQLLREIQPQAKFILTLSDPVKRMFSDYYFLEDNLKPVRPGGASSKSARQFHDRAKLQVEMFQKCVRNYVDSLQDEIATSKNYHYIARNSSDAAILAAVRDSVPKEYQNVFPLWFRASQMCAHDRHSFGVGGHGRLSIGLYVLYLEKWLEHFPLSQFLVLRLEDYEKDPKSHMKKVFDHLGLDDPDDWDRILHSKHFNEHKVHRDVILEETETLLRAFHKPYNALLAAILKNPEFQWEPLLVNGVRITLRSQQIVAARQEQQSLDNDNEDPDRSLLVPRAPGEHPEHNAHGIDRHADPLYPPPQHPHEGDDRRPGVPANLRGHRVSGNTDLAYQLKPRRFSLDNLPVPRDEDLEAVDIDAMAMDLTEMKVGKEVCTAAFTLNIAQLKAWFYEIGVPGTVVSLGDGRRTAFHCLAALYTMGEAHSRSHVFAELKGKETWVTKLFDPPLEAKMSSVLSRDITDHLSGAILRTAAWLLRAGVPLDAVDTGGNTALHVAVLGGETSLVRFFIDSGSALDIANNDKRTPLHFAAAYGHAEICGMLMAAGAKSDIHDINGVSAMDIIMNPGPILKEDAKTFMNIDQRPARQIDRRLHPELHPSDERLGWKPGTGGWSPERLKGFETDMECNVVDQYFADEITGEEIFKNYLAHNAPVLIRGLLSDWPVTTLYQMDVLMEDHGDLSVQVSDIPYAQKFGGGQQVTMTLREYIEEVKAHQIVGGNHPWYVFKGHPIPSASDRADSLVKYETCPIPDILATAFAQASPPNAMNMNQNNNNNQNEASNKRFMFVNAQWALGGAGTGAPIHFHNTAWAALVYGAKKWMIYPPHNMIMSNRQILDFYETEKDTFAARGVKPVTCVQTAGDVMIIPESWGHGVLNIQETIAIATEFKHAVWRMKPPVHSVSSGAPNFDNRVDRPPLDPGRRVATQDNLVGRSAAKKRFLG